MSSNPSDRERQDCVPWGDRDDRTRLRPDAIAWGESRGWQMNGTNLELAIAGILVRWPIYELTERSALVRATANRPRRLAFTVESKSWTLKLHEAVVSPAVVTGDVEFDAHHHVTTVDPSGARGLLDDACRVQCCAMPDEYRASYLDGAIEVWLGADVGVSGAHVLAAAHLAVALARAEPTVTPYR